MLAYADDVAVVTDNNKELQEAMRRWTDVLKRRGMKISKTKTEVMSNGRQREELDVFSG